MATQFISLAGWWFLPNLVTQYVQPVLYTIFTRAGEPKPAPGSAKFNKHRKIIHAAVILIYLLYTIVDAEYQLQLSGNFYRMFGVPVDVSEKALRSRWRRIAATLHPDKSPNQDTHLFTQLQVIFDTLSNPSKRFGYDRFGPEILTWQSCKFTRDYVEQALYQIAAYYAGSIGVLMIIAWAGYFQTGIFWRFFIMAVMFTVEIASATRPEFFGALKTVNALVNRTGWREGEYLPFQFIVMMRKVAFTIFIAINQLAPLLENSHEPNLEQSEKGMDAQIMKIRGISGALDGEVDKLCRLQMAPWAVDGDEEKLKEGLRSFMEGNAMNREEEVARAMIGVIQRRKRREEEEREEKRGAGVGENRR